MAKMAAVMGVPNSPEKAADMPHMTMDPAVLLIQVDLSAHPGPDGAPQLEGGPLPASRPAYQVGQDGGQEDEGGGAQTDGSASRTAVSTRLVPRVPLHPAPAVEQDDDHASQGKEKNDPGLVLPELSRPVDSVMKRHRNSAHDEPDVAGVQDPFEKGQRLVDVAPYPGGKCGHGIGLPSDRPWGPALIILPLSYHKIAGLPPFFHDSDFRSLFRETKTERDSHRAPAPVSLTFVPETAIL